MYIDSKVCFIHYSIWILFIFILLYLVWGSIVISLRREKITFLKIFRFQNLMSLICSFKWLCVCMWLNFVYALPQKLYSIFRKRIWKETKMGKKYFKERLGTLCSVWYCICMFSTFWTYYKVINVSDECGKTEFS